MNWKELLKPSAGRIILSVIIAYTILFFTFRIFIPFNDFFLSIIIYSAILYPLGCLIVCNFRSVDFLKITVWKLLFVGLWFLIFLFFFIRIFSGIELIFYSLLSYPLACLIAWPLKDKMGKIKPFFRITKGKVIVFLILYFAPLIIAYSSALYIWGYLLGPYGMYAILPFTYLITPLYLSGILSSLIGYQPISSILFIIDPFWSYFLSCLILAICNKITIFKTIKFSNKTVLILIIFIILLFTPVIAIQGGELIKRSQIPKSSIYLPTKNEIESLGYTVDEIDMAGTRTDSVPEFGAVPTGLLSESDIVYVEYNYSDCNRSYSNCRYTASGRGFYEEDSKKIVVGVEIYDTIENAKNEFDKRYEDNYAYYTKEENKDEGSVTIGNQKISDHSFYLFIKKYRVTGEYNGYFIKGRFLFVADINDHGTIDDVINIANIIGNKIK